MKIWYANKLIKNLEISDPTMCVYQLIYYENDNDVPKYTIFYYAWNAVMHQGRWLCEAYVLCIVIHL